VRNVRVGSDVMALLAGMGCQFTWNGSHVRFTCLSLYYYWACIGSGKLFNKS